MTLKYEFGGNDYISGDNFEYEVDDTKAAIKVMTEVLGAKTAKLVISEYADFFKINELLEDNEDWLHDQYEAEAREEWENSFWDDLKENGYGEM